MTRIEVNDKGTIHEIKIEGHAGFSKAGSDIVCAAVSALAYTFVNRLEDLMEKERVESLDYQEKDGFIGITFDSDTTEALASFETIKIGFLMLEQNYPQNILYKGRK